MVKIEGVDFMCPVCTELIYKPVAARRHHKIYSMSIFTRTTFVLILVF